MLIPPDKALILLSGCLSGHYRYGSIGECKPCPKGTYRGFFTSQCLPCPEGTTTESDGQASASACRKLEKYLISDPVKVLWILTLLDLYKMFDALRSP